LAPPPLPPPPPDSPTAARPVPGRALPKYADRLSHGVHRWVGGKAETAAEKLARGVPRHIVNRNARRKPPRQRRDDDGRAEWDPYW
jgi:hypothetical protein